MAEPLSRAAPSCAGGGCMEPAVCSQVHVSGETVPAPMSSRSVEGGPGPGRGPALPPFIAFRSRSVGDMHGAPAGVVPVHVSSLILCSCDAQPGFSEIPLPGSAAICKHGATQVVPDLNINLFCDGTWEKRNRTGSSFQVQVQRW